MKDYRTRPEQPDPEELINFIELHDTHRVGFYKEWMIVEPYDEMDGEILCYLPSIEWEDGSFPDLDYLKDYHTAEWEAGNLVEAIEFIDSYVVDDFAEVAEAVMGEAPVDRRRVMYEAVLAERDRQDSKWGYPQENSFCEWSSILGEEYGELAEQLNEANFGRGDKDSLITEAIHVAAVAFSIIEHYEVAELISTSFQGIRFK